MIGQMAIAIALPRFNYLGRSVTPIFLLMDHFLYRFSTSSEKMKKIISLDFLQNAASNGLNGQNRVVRMFNNSASLIRDYSSSEASPQNGLSTLYDVANACLIFYKTRLLTEREAFTSN